MGKKLYIFPLNYNQKEKLLGIVEYRIVAVILGWGIILFNILKWANLSLKISIYIAMVFFLFPSILLMVGFLGESMLDFFKYILKYMLKSKVYVYRREE